MANIYEQDSKRLHDIISDSGHTKDATILIPDLQRPYVWTPKQVTLLIDSLIRGWPFGTLLMWKIAKDQIAQIPNRPFWTTVDRVTTTKNQKVTEKNPPSEFFMVLDGQQRVQSLLLALGGDNWGFKLDDRDWHEIIHNNRKRGKRGKITHWSKGSLCLNLSSFSEALKQQTGNYPEARKVDYSSVLEWVINDPQEGQNSESKPNNYDYPLKKSSDHPGQYIRLSRLWDWAGLNQNTSFRDLNRKLPELIKDENIPSDLFDCIREPLAELLELLLDVKFSQVTYLQLMPFDKNSQDEDTYNDAIVNVFTRLNTAGRTLTTEEITYAWLKTGWNLEATNNVNAEGCIEGLRDTLSKDCELHLQPDETISLLSFMWSTVFQDGKLLSKKDHLKGDRIKPMAHDLAQNWSAIQNSIIDTCLILKDRELRYKQQFSSLNSLAVLCSWNLISKRWKSTNNHLFKELERQSFDDLISDKLRLHCDRWLFLTQWSGRWTSSSYHTAEYAKNLSNHRNELQQLTSITQARSLLDKYFVSEFKTELKQDAKSYIDSLSASRRSGVRYYFGALWLWHRLDQTRWDLSSTPLRVKSRCTIKHDVDHIVPVKIWDNKIANGSNFTGSEIAGHALGNCFLLEKNFNISKSAKSITDFISESSELSDNSKKAAFFKALAIDSNLQEPEKITAVDLEKSIAKRTQDIRSDLHDFIEGNTHRRDT